MGARSPTLKAFNDSIAWHHRRYKRSIIGRSLVKVAADRDSLKSRMVGIHDNLAMVSSSARSLWTYISCLEHIAGDDDIGQTFWLLGALEGVIRKADELTLA